MQQQKKKQRQEPAKFQFCDVKEEEVLKEPSKEPSKEQSKETNTLHTPTTKLMEETLHVPGAWADLLLEDTDPSWTTVQRKKRKTK